jgi:hypothetical protein
VLPLINVWGRFNWGREKIRWWNCCVHCFRESSQETVVLSLHFLTLPYGLVCRRCVNWQRTVEVVSVQHRVTSSELWKHFDYIFRRVASTRERVAVGGLPVEPSSNGHFASVCHTHACTSRLGSVWQVRDRTATCLFVHAVRLTGYSLRMVFRQSADSRPILEPGVSRLRIGTAKSPCSFEGVQSSAQSLLLLKVQVSILDLAHLVGPPHSASCPACYRRLCPSRTEWHLEVRIQLYFLSFRFAVHDQPLKSMWRR